MYVRTSECDRQIDREGGEERKREGGKGGGGDQRLSSACLV